jgi:hypothetical protein
MSFGSFAHQLWFALYDVAVNVAMLIESKRHEAREDKSARWALSYIS